MTYTSGLVLLSLLLWLLLDLLTRLSPSCAGACACLLSANPRLPMGTGDNDTVSLRTSSVATCLQDSLVCTIVGNLAPQCGD